MMKCFIRFSKIEGTIQKYFFHDPIEKMINVLKKCTGCHVANYCGKECQKKDWTTHKMSHSEHEMTKRMNTQNLSEVIFY